MAEGHELARALRAHHARDDRGREHRPFGRSDLERVALERIPDLR